MVTIGNSTLPGVTTTVESASSTGVNVAASAQVGMVGQADLSTGTASANTVYEVKTPVKARELFGSGSLLAEAVVDALTEGAYPVYAVATAGTSVTNEDIFSDGQSGTLANSPITEDADSVTFTVDSVDQTTVKTYKDPTTVTLQSGETAYNPVTGAYAHDAAPGTTAVVDYEHFDYPSAVDALKAAQAEKIDILAIVNENSSAVSDAHTEVGNMEGQYNFAIVLAGAAVHIADTSTFSNSYDSSRIAQVYPSRNTDDLSVIGSYAGLLARLGINNTSMFKRLESQTDLKYTLSEADQTNLIGENVIPLADESAGARIVDDLTSVTDTNNAESNMRSILHRLIVDYVTEQVHETSQKFIGELHTPSARNALRANITSRLGRLMDLNAITGYTVTVEKVDAMTASVDVGIDTIDPLRNIEATVTAGAVSN